MIKHIDTPIVGKAVMPTGRVIALRQRDPWKEATQRARDVALYRETIVRDIEAQQSIGRSQNKAISLLLKKAEMGMLSPHLSMCVKQAAKAGRSAPSRSVLSDWCKAYRDGGIIALLPEHKGRVTEMAAWWGPALEYYNAPSKPDISTVHRRLTEIDGFTVTYDQLRSYLSSVPAMYGKNSPARLGNKTYRLTQKAYIRRSTQNALPGDVYVADGYRADVYLAHPITGDIWRPEITLAIDLRSRMIVGWRADEHEGTYAVQNMWAETFARWNHVPPLLYVDNGSGYKNKLMDDELTGFYARVGIADVIHSLPGNPHGKGWVERTFRIIKDDFLKLWRPEFYCGPDHSPDVLERVTRECKAGRIQPPSLAEFTEAFNAWIDRYAHRPHPEDKSVTRAEVWSGLVPIPPAASLPEMKYQAVTLTVRKASIKQGKRAYAHENLHAYNGKKVVLEYDLMNDRIAVVRDQSGRWICDAHLVESIQAIAENRLEEKRQIRAKNAVKLLNKKMDEQLARAGQIIDVDDVVERADWFLPAESGANKPLILDFSADDEGVKND